MNIYENALRKIEHDQHCKPSCNVIIGPTGPTGPTGPSGGPTGATPRLFYSSFLFFKW